MNRSVARSRSRAEEGEPKGVLIHGWMTLIHPCFLDQIDKLVTSVEEWLDRHPTRFRDAPDFKVLAAITHLAFDEIPRDPGRPEYRHGGALSRRRRHWLRAKFGAQRFRLFFRYRSAERIIVYAWVNDSETLRTYGSATDAYTVFSLMLEGGSPPDSWEQLLGEARAEPALERMDGVLARLRRMEKNLLKIPASQESKKRKG
jgi:toxin YhaV